MDFMSKIVKELTANLPTSLASNLTTSTHMEGKQVQSDQGKSIFFLYILFAILHPCPQSHALSPAYTYYILYTRCPKKSVNNLFFWLNSEISCFYSDLTTGDFLKRFPQLTGLYIRNV